jgi:hypothetical protein
MKTDILLWSYLAQCFVEWEMFHSEDVDKNQNTYLMFGNFYLKSCAIYEIAWKHFVELDRPQITCGTGTLHARILRLQTHTYNM